LVSDSQHPEPPNRRPVGAVVGYGLMVAFTVVVFLVIRGYGPRLLN
jgi:hypothetical protein